MGEAGPEGRKRASRAAIDGENGVTTGAAPQARPLPQAWSGSVAHQAHLLKSGLQAPASRLSDRDHIRSPPMELIKLSIAGSTSLVAAQWYAVVRDRFLASK